MIFTTPLLAALACAAVASTAPTEDPHKRDVYSPPVLYPHTGTVWYSGQRHNVTWDNSNPPQNISNRALIFLRTSAAACPVILAHDFDLRAGRVEVTVPQVLSTQYNLILFGDSGNLSEEFTIEGPVDL